MTKIKDANINDIPIIQDIAEKTWWPTFSEILTAEQIRYMLDTIYDAEALAKTMTEGSQRYILLESELSACAFAAYGPRKENPKIIKLHKIYILPQHQGKGYGVQLIDEIKRRLIAQKITILDLNVNRYNRAKNFYEKLGFKVIAEEDVPIGPYWMNDFVMRLII